MQVKYQRAGYDNTTTQARPEKCEQKDNKTKKKQKSERESEILILLLSPPTINTATTTLRLLLLLLLIYCTHVFLEDYVCSERVRGGGVVALGCLIGKY